eukprot:1537409-Rhodomonas_salina.2
MTGVWAEARQGAGAVGHRTIPLDELAALIVRFQSCSVASCSLQSFSSEACSLRVPLLRQKGGRSAAGWRARGQGA